jgi:hypothetical protein
MRDLEDLLVSMRDPSVTSRNDLISALQDEQEARRRRAIEALEATEVARAEAQARLRQSQDGQPEISRREDQLQRFGEACKATVDEARVAEVAAKSEMMPDRQKLAEALERELEAGRHRSAEYGNESRRQKEAANETPSTPVAPVIDMRFYIDNLGSLRIEAADHTLTGFSDYWAPDFRKTTQNRPNTFVPNHLVQGSYPMWAPFYDPGLTRQDTDGSPQVDPNHLPFFRVSQELLGRALHKFKRKYIDGDDQRKTDKDLSEHINAVTSNVKEGVANAARLLRERKDNILKKHEETMAATHDHMAEASRVYRETVDRHVVCCDASTVIARHLLSSARSQRTGRQTQKDGSLNACRPIAQAG